MAAANESQGLKIAVAASITLMVIMAVTSYFLYSAYARSEALLEGEREKVAAAKKAESLAASQSNELMQLAGAKANEFDPAKAEIGAAFKKATERVANLVNSTNAAIQRAQQAGAEGKDLADLQGRVQLVVNSFQSEPNKNFVSTMDRLLELLENVTLLNTEMSTNYVSLRKGLESSTSVAKTSIDAHSKAAADSKKDLEDEHNKHDQSRSELLTKVDQLQTDNNNKATQIANQETQLRQLKEENDRRHELDMALIKEQRDLLGLKENVLDKPDGYITYVDLERGEVHVNLTRRQGAKPQMKMTIFAAGSPGVPTEQPKGNIMLTQVGDQYSVAQITRVNSSIEPFRVGDIVYSAAWSPEEPTRFALIGKIDVNRDGVDDRQDLKRMIEESGGFVEYDLPPPETSQKESGKLSSRIDWYVIDDRKPLREVFASRSPAAVAAGSEFEKKYGKVIKECRDDGIRPMPIGRLLAYLGYDMGTPVIGRVEAINSNALQRLTEPRRQAEQPKGAPAAERKAEEPRADEPKADEPK
ncbi:hypothetical protein OJF2_28780 [Aquisphaera giovannonii]|uniref:Uncharacterized protein n=1 Tax=Aquisphaera giovannonii TaxID=406548 RepID=A0A5B9W120_9BACT|nr:hypothetical protein [Aquisphaera giovannonii]QEH34342.1 hypothetical protein OJF2_28780 [Aquisphaera giovannonii]